ncbi:hypothetical protein DFP72DRAFT_1033867 [Ephemerocybe angulata]|uniref:Uncharacterized protein n=1 Tax=Ephemerocybe angulata TaxID=980116 RepID=A0A8H6LSN2_9AGAR|nr:hypothetical protein DFP72DRAFT_1135700 [Tulosesus angulatus]KAF6752559.1 hypothetical protein DFP72DRAFT_1033867 [Tulosesus angulatus]
MSRAPSPSGKENAAPASTRYGTAKKQIGKKRPCNALELGPRKRPTLPDPLIHHGRHFGRSIFAFANVHALILAGLALKENDIVETKQERREARVYKKLLKMVPGLEDRLLEAEGGDEDDIFEVASLLQKGASSARSDDTKSLKGAILDWIVPQGQALQPSLARNVKIDRGFNHERTGELLCPGGMDWSDPEVKQQLKNREVAIPGNHWPLFVYQNEIYPDSDAKSWDGLFRSKILVNAYKHVFTSPSSVEEDPKATRSGNARIHGMTSVTPASIAYIATQVRFALSSASVFCRTDKETDSETFYTSVLELFEDPEEQGEVKDLIAWWNRQVFPSFSNTKKVIPSNSILSRIKARRAAIKAAAAALEPESEEN